MICYDGKSEIALSTSSVTLIDKKMMETETIMANEKILDDEDAIESVMAVNYNNLLLLERLTYIYVYVT